MSLRLYDVDDYLAGRRVPNIELKVKAALARGHTVPGVAHDIAAKTRARQLAQACRPCRLVIGFDDDPEVFFAL
jgi:hypothetical protein